jgi:hypothetical protein
VRRWMLRPEIDGEVTRRSFAHGALASTIRSTRTLRPGVPAVSGACHRNDGDHAPSGIARNRVAAPAFSRRPPTSGSTRSWPSLGPTGREPAA